MNTLSQITGNPFFSVALPIVVTLIVASWSGNKRLDELSRRIDSIDAQLRALTSEISRLNERLTRVEERGWLSRS